MILYLKDLKNSMKKLLQQSSSIQINIQKSVAFLNTNNDQTEKELRKIIIFTIPSKIPRNQLNKGSERLLQYKQTTEERNLRRHQKMERSSMLID
jgi:hypothetical protein